MRLSRLLRATSLLLTVAAGLALCPGCADSVPATGTAAAPVDKDQAAQQNKAMQDFYKAKMKPAKK